MEEDKPLPFLSALYTSGKIKIKISYKNKSTLIYVF